MTSIQAEDRATTVAVERPSRRSRPSNQYWDHRTAAWQVPGPIPTPRRAQ